MKSIKKFLVLLSVLVLALVVVACKGKEPKPEPEPEKNYVVSIAEESPILLEVGENKILNASVTEGGTFTWSTGNASVATVDSDGKVLAIGEGSTEITATCVEDSTKKASVTVTVSKVSAKEVSISGTNTVRVGEFVQLTATISPANAIGLVVWSVDKADVATIDENGKLTGVKPGEVVVTAKVSDAVTSTFKVTVTTPLASSVAISGANSLKVGKTLQLSAKISPNLASDATVTWSSDKTNIVTVDANGLVTAVAAGKAVITATVVQEGLTAEVKSTIEIEVLLPDPTTIELYGEDCALDIGGTKQYTAQAGPSGTNNKVEWISSNPFVATVDETGKVTAKIPGETIIYAKTCVKDLYKSVKVTVNPVAATKVNMIGEATLFVGQAETFSASVSPALASQEVVWTVEDTTIATANAGGVITPLKTGTTKVIATAANSTVKAELEITVEAAIECNNEKVVGVALAGSAAGAEILVDNKTYIFGTNAFASLEDANITAGDKIIMLSGEYGKYTLKASNVYFTVAEDAEVVLNDVFTLGTTKTVNDVVVPDIEVKNVVFDKIRMTGVGQFYGVGGNSNIIFKNIIADASTVDASQGTIFFNGDASNIKVLDSKFINNKAARNIRFEKAIVGLEVKNCYFDNNGGQYDPIRAQGVISGTVNIINCVFKGSNQSALMFMQVGNTNINVMGCEFYDLVCTAVDFRTSGGIPCTASYNVCYNIFDNTNCNVENVWGCIRMRYNNFNDDTMHVSVNYNKFINWLEPVSKYIFDDATSDDTVYKLMNWDYNYYDFNELNDQVFNNCACSYAHVLTSSEVDRYIDLYKLDTTGDEVKIVGEGNYTKPLYESIAAALEAANEGDTIYVLPGTYNEDLTINKNNITIRSLNYGLNPNEDIDRYDEAVFTGKITLAKGLAGLTIDGLKFTGNAQILNSIGDAGTTETQANVINVNGFNFLNNIVESGLATGKGFIYFVEADCCYSHDLVFEGNKFSNTDAAGTEAIVYIDNVYNLTVFNNTFANAKGKAFYINDATKGLSGEKVYVVDNKFENCANGFWANWMSPLPANTETAEVYIDHNEFTNISDIALHVGRMNNTDNYACVEINYNTFKGVNVGADLDRVHAAVSLTFNYNVFLDVPTTAYIKSNQLSTSSPCNVDAKYCAFYTNGALVTPIEGKFVAASAGIDYSENILDMADMPEFEEFATEIVILTDSMFAGEPAEIELAFDPSSPLFRDVEWISSDETILKFENGIAYPLRSGTVTVTAIYKQNRDIKAESEIVVEEYNVLEVRFDGNGILEAGEELELVATTENVGENAKLIWTSKDPSIATVDENGKVTAVAAGNATIECQIEGTEKKVTIGVTVIGADLTNELLKLLVEANNGVIMYQEIGYIGYETGFEFVPHWVYGSANKYYAAQLPAIQKQMLSTTARTYTEAGTHENIKLITVHDTGSATASSTAKANSSYCINGAVTASTSWHYTIGNDGIFQQLEDDRVGWHAGDGSETPTGTIDTGVKAKEAGKRATVTIDDGYYVVDGTKTQLLAPKGPNGETLTTADIVDSGIVTIIGDNGNYFINTYYNSTYKKIASYGGYESIGIETAVNKGSDVYLTWQYVAKFVAQKLNQYDLTLDRVVQHNNLSGKNCPQTMRTAGLWDEFMKMVEIEYIIQKDYSDYTIEFKSSNPDVLDDSGRVVGQGPRESTQVEYTITVSKGAQKASQTVSVLVVGTRNAK